jgi:hypothetical protein
LSVSEVKINDITIEDSTNTLTAVINWEVNDSVDKKGIQEKYGIILCNKESYLDLIGDLNTGYSCTIKRGPTLGIEYTKINGSITNISEEGDIIRIVVRNEWWNLTKKEVTKSYDANIDDEAGELSAIWLDLVQNDGGITASAVSSGTGADEIRQKWPIKDEKISDMCDEIVSLLNWVQYYDDDAQTAYLEPEGTTSYPTDLEVGVNVTNVPRWDDDYEAAINIIKVTGAIRREGRTELFSGDGTTDTFTLLYEPKDTEIYVDSVLQVRGVENAADSFDYEVDEQNKKIEFQSGSVPASGTDNIEIFYTRNVPQAVIARSQDSIDKLNFESQNTYNFDDIRTVADAKLKANKLLSAFAFGFTNTRIETTEIEGLSAGQLVHIIDGVNNRNEYLTVKEAVYRYPSAVDSLTLGNKRFKTTQVLNDFKTRIKRLEQKDITLDEFLQQLVYALLSFKLKVRYHKTLTRDTTPDGIWGLGFSDGAGNRVNWGVTGATWQGSYTNSKVTVSDIPGGLLFGERLYDEKFNDSGTATWDTSNKRIDFTAGQTQIIGPLSLGFTPANYLVTTGTETGTILIEISGDGKVTWETVSKNNTTIFNSADSTGVYIRLTENNSSTARIENTFDENGDYERDAISVLLSE